MTRPPAAEGDALADIAFAGPIIEWRGPAPFFFVAVPAEHVGELRYAAQLASYGWGVIPVQATLDDADFTTSLFPRDGGYLVPLKLAVRKPSRTGTGDIVRIRLRVLDPHLQP